MTIRTSTSAEPLLSGGGLDGQVGRIVSLLLQRAVTNTASLASAATLDAMARRDFDFAETIAWACNQAGVSPAVPARTDMLLIHCHNRRTLITTEQALALKGALLFNGASVAVTIGLRRRVLLYSPSSGVVVTGESLRSYKQGARIPGARGYR
jgi:hypothetical protein